MEAELGFSWHTSEDYKVENVVRILLDKQMHDLLAVIDFDKDRPWIWKRVGRVSRLEGWKESKKRWDYRTISKTNNKKLYWNKIESKR